MPDLIASPQQWCPQQDWQDASRLYNRPDVSDASEREASLPHVLLMLCRKPSQGSHGDFVACADFLLKQLLGLLT